MSHSVQPIRLQQRGLRCVECGGSLEVGRDLQLLQCTHCATAQLQCEGAGIEALIPAGRLGRRRIVANLRSQLHACGWKGHVLRRAQLRWLPFWHVEGRLVAWTRYYEKVEVRSPELPGAAAGEELQEESLARPVQFSLPACELRGVALLGVAYRLEGRSLRPLPQATTGSDEIVCAVQSPPATALRQAHASAERSLLPRNALRPALRSTLIRSRVRLIYYPIWNLDYEVRGRAHRIAFDGLSGVPLGGTLPRLRRRPTRRWLASAALAGWLVGWHPLFAAASWLGWAFYRLRADGEDAARQGWLAWWSAELAGSQLRSEAAWSAGAEP
jgi:hypothetical protein